MSRPPPAPPERLHVRSSTVAPVVVPVTANGVKPFTIRKTKSFYHTGDLGDIVAALSAMKALGGGRLQIGPDIGFPMTLGRPRNPGSHAVVENVYDFFMLQPYIESVEYRETQQLVDFNFNLFRTWMADHQQWDAWRNSQDLTGYHSLASAQQALFNVRLPESQPWLEVDTTWPIDGKPIVIHRSPRYHNDPDTFPWDKVVENYGSKIVFVGYEEEHAEFCRLYGKVRFVWCGNVLRMARMIAGAKLYIGNQSSPFWIAEGLKQNLILEVWNGDPNCNFRRSGHTAIFDGDWPMVRKTIDRYINADETIVLHDVQESPGASSKDASNKPV